MAILLVMALPCLCREITSSPLFVPNEADTTLTVSLITCYPGPEVYELCGHSAVRVRGEGIDSVWNFGIFDFNQPNFIYRFVKGETDYKCAAYPFAWFLPEYIRRGSKVVEQDLNFTPEESRRMLKLLRSSALPENATYRYNYIKDNCSTRILDRADKASQEKIIYPDTVAYGSFRNEMRKYHEGYPWYQFGIDIALGSGLDYPITSREEMFVPVEMEKKAAIAHFSDGRPLVKATRILNDASERAVLPPTPWFLAPLFWSWILTILTFIIAGFNLAKNKITSAYYIAWFLMLGIAGCLVAFLVFISVHEATSPNWVILWLNPFQFLFVIGLTIKKLRSIAVAMAYYNIFAVGGIMIISPFITQSFNSAFYPLMLSTVALALIYAIIINKSSYKLRKEAHE